jgi:hypothetical protein
MGLIKAYAYNVPHYSIHTTNLFSIHTTNLPNISLYSISLCSISLCSINSSSIHSPNTNTSSMRPDIRRRAQTIHINTVSRDSAFDISTFFNYIKTTPQTRESSADSP